MRTARPFSVTCFRGSLTGKTDVIEILEVAPRQEDDSGDAYPNGLVAEIEDIKRRLQAIEGRVHFLWDIKCT
jgi:hypothetical protein